MFLGTHSNGASTKMNPSSTRASCPSGSTNERYGDAMTLALIRSLPENLFCRFQSFDDLTSVTKVVSPSPKKIMMKRPRAPR
eukprot:917774-Amphidinium_carterae.1